MTTVKLNIDGVEYNCTPVSGTAPVPTPPIVTPPIVTPPPVSGTCPPPPSNMLTGDLGPSGSLYHSRLQSGQVVSFPLPQLKQQGFHSNQASVVETTATAPGSLLEMCISKCPGVIDKNAGKNYYESYTQNFNQIAWFYDTTPPYTPSWVEAAGYALALPADGPWYLNVKVTYPSAPQGYDERVIQWGTGPR
jgi:hypothetical protein